MAFLLLIVAGGILLKLPWMNQGEAISWLDAFFIATSAVCVTGLSTIDVANSLNFYGQLILLMLIQLGGVGIITVSSFLLFMGRKKVSISYEEMLSSTIAVSQEFTFRKITFVVLKFTFLIELIGALLLLPLWSQANSWPERVWAAIFHSVSAFCNAGFALYSNNLEGFSGEIGINFVLMFLIITGGFGFVNLQELWKLAKTGKFKWRNFSFFLKVSLTFTAFLICFGACSVFLFEANGSMKNLSFFEKVTASFFTSITTRTAGFNTLPLPEFSNQTLFIMILLMFIGGISGSCAGGIKVNSIAVIFSVIWSRIRNYPNPVLFRRSLPPSKVRQVVSLIFLSQILIVLALLMMQAVETGSISHSESNGSFLEYSFEVVSALGTAGLSMGMTSKLTVSGKIFIIILMFIGRLGPLTIAVAWLRRKEDALPFTYPEENIPIG